MRWIAEALGRILEHKDPLHSLGLKPRPAHAPGDPQAAIDVAWWIACAKKLGHDAREAAGLAAEAFAKDLKSIQRYQAKAGEWTQGMNPDASAWARYFKARGKPLPEWNKKARLPVPTKKLR